jgi:hypothetical protein
VFQFGEFEAEHFEQSAPLLNKRSLVFVKDLFRG